MRKWKRGKNNHFKLEFDKKLKNWYIIKVKDEHTKNHKDINETVTVLMPQSKDDRLCPIGFNNMCMEHLNPNNNYLW